MSGRMQVRRNRRLRGWGLVLRAKTFGGVSTALLALALGAAAPLSGQSSQPRPDNAAFGVVQSATGAGEPRQVCSYDECALRLWSSDVLRGTEEAKIGQLGFLRPTPLGDLFAQSDSAALHFETVEKNYTIGRAITITSRVVSLAGLVLSFSSDSAEQRWGFGLQATGFAGGWLGKRRVTHAKEALSRAIWWYNRDVVRAGPMR